MNPRPNDARERVLAGAADMLARHSPNATSLRELARHSGAPFGSTYHHFPGGKQQVIAEAVGKVGEKVDAMLNEQLEAGVAAEAGASALVHHR